MRRRAVKFFLSPVERAMVNGFGYRFWLREHVTRLNNRVAHHWRTDDKCGFGFWPVLLIIVPLAYSSVPVLSHLLKRRLLHRLQLSGALTVENETNVALLYAIQGYKQATLH